MTGAAELELARTAPAAIGVVARIGAVLAVAPPFAHAAVPRRVRALLAVALAIGIVPTLPAIPSLPRAWGEMLIGVGGDVVIGLAMGLALTRAMLTAHFFSDVFVGAAVGLLVGRETFLIGFPQLAPGWF